MQIIFQSTMWISMVSFVIVRWANNVVGACQLRTALITTISVCDLPNFLENRELTIVFYTHEYELIDFAESKIEFVGGRSSKVVKCLVSWKINFPRVIGKSATEGNNPNAFYFKVFLECN